MPPVSAKGFLNLVITDANGDTDCYVRITIKDDGSGMTMALAPVSKMPMPDAITSLFQRLEQRVNA